LDPLVLRVEGIRKKDSFWLTISKVSVCGHLVWDLWACGGTVHLGGYMGWSSPLYLMEARRQREIQEEVGSHGPNLLSLGPTS
jgi:hypothetical protein